MKINLRFLPSLGYSVQHHWPVWGAVTLLWIIVITIWTKFIQQSSAPGIIYLLDDAYIHMAIAKNLSQFGVFGVSPYSFSSSSSSIIWPLLITLGYFIFGVTEWIPLGLNLLVATGILVLLASIYYQHFTNQWGILVLLLGTIGCSPLLPTIFSGMEHLLQALFTIWILYKLAEHLTLSRPANAAFLIFLALCITLIRFEGCALIVLGGIALTFKKQWKTAILFCGAGLLPIVGYGAISTFYGWLPLPNSVVLKARQANLQTRSIFDLITHGLGQSWNARYFSASLVMVMGLMLIQRQTTKRNPLLLCFAGLLLAASAIHLEFGLAGLFFY